MATAKSVDEYIDNLFKQEPIVYSITDFISYFFVAIAISYVLISKGFPLVTYVVVAVPIFYFIKELHERRRKIGNQIWNILCPKCNEYIPLHQFVCEPPCEHEYTDRSIIEGCPVCKSRYKKKGHDAFRRAICDNCGYELEFSEPYDFKPWSVLAKDQTWETETILSSKGSVYGYFARYSFIAGALILIATFGLFFYGIESKMFIWLRYAGIYLVSLGVLFVLIQKFLYGAKRRVPNPTFKRNEEPKEIYVEKRSRGTILFFEILTPLLFMWGVALLSFMLILMFHLRYDVVKEELVTYTPFEIIWRLIFLAVPIILIVYHGVFYEAYKKVPNPRYKEKES